MQNIHLVFKTHLDVGFTDYASVVTHNYFKKYIPASLRVARQMRDFNSPERFIWTTGSWLIYEYLEQADNLERAEMEAAIELGEIAWHALPFTTHTELMDPELFRFGLSLSRILDNRFGKKTIAAKMTDVPGHTRGIVPLLAEAGVSFLHIGVNPASTVPGVPPLFRWQDDNGSELIVMYESGYGDAFQVDGLDLALAFGHTNDNMGPQTPDQVLEVYREKRIKFPDANIFASTLDAFAAQLEPVRSSLPVVKQEVGDTWIHGVGSDPVKVSRYRELLRLRAEWLQQRKTGYQEKHFFNFNRFMLLVPEHTWGMDEKTFLWDHENYSNERFSAVKNSSKFKKFESSWVEKRNNVQKAVNALEDTPPGIEARARLASIRPLRPDLSGWSKISKKSLSIRTDHLSAQLDSDSPALLSLKQEESGQVWADGAHPMGEFSYQTFSAEDYDRFYSQYLINIMQNGDWPREDFCKPGLELAKSVSRLWKPIPLDCYERQIEDRREVLYRLTFEKECLIHYGAPKESFLVFSFPHTSPGFSVELQWFRKGPCRMPEALWMGFVPLLLKGAEWRIDKLGRSINPLEVVENGNRHLHAAGRSVDLVHRDGQLSIFPLDAPLVAPGQPSLLDFNNRQPDLEKGMHFCLWNNIWGTNFPMWFEEDCHFRFEIKFTDEG